ncbi:hypothetical protein [Cognatiyoonia sp. IB215182]|uniref:hypothetical protein n=1 Tax=Cognatiyoonia sp. IB215182 TaxID=3097353 RepID=UPI002A0C52D8|nr:hypothetical protein [Cognatiyoonia sp. IB215182]MDX8353965.1 hypothetical protein [Cognatiyoonia sp. IB215182]
MPKSVLAIFLQHLTQLQQLVQLTIIHLGNQRIQLHEQSLTGVGDVLVIKLEKLTHGMPMIRWADEPRQGQP